MVPTVYRGSGMTVIGVVNQRDVGEKRGHSSVVKSVLLCRTSAKVLGTLLSTRCVAALQAKTMTTRSTFRFVYSKNFKVGQS